MTSKRTSDTTSRTQLAARVLRRHLRAVSQAEPEIVFTTRSESVSVIYSDGGVISSSDLRRLLRDRIGHIIRLDFSLGGTQAPNVVLWTALLHDGEIVDGRLILHAQVRPDRVTSWAEIMIDPTDAQLKTATAGPRARLEDIAARVREIIQHVREQPTYGPPEL